MLFHHERCAIHFRTRCSERFRVKLSIGVHKSIPRENSVVPNVQIAAVETSEVGSAGH
jgi:hypothetical protein